MVRTALFSVLTVAGLALPIATATAAPPVVIYPAVAPVYYPPSPVVIGQTWTVRYRTPGLGHWHLYRTYASPYLADLAARGWTVFETSAKTGAKVEEAFLTLAAGILAQDEDDTEDDD